VAYLHDNVDAWTMDAHGHYSRVQAAKPKRSTSVAKQVAKPVMAHGAQAALMALHGNKM
jgi:hypothetical protein